MKSIFEEYERNLIIEKQIIKHNVFIYLLYLLISNDIQINEKYERILLKNFNYKK